MCLGKVKEAWYLIWEPSVSVIMRLSVRVRLPRPPTRLPLAPLPPRPRPPRPLEWRPPVVAWLIWRLVLFWTAPICGGCFWFTIFRNKDNACSYVMLVGTEISSISSRAFVGVRKSALILSTSIRIFIESEWKCVLRVWHMRWTILWVFLRIDHRIWGGFSPA
jgi:hypothetical protein